MIELEEEFRIHIIPYLSIEQGISFHLIFTNRIETRKTKRSFLCTLFGDETNFLERPLIDQPSCLQIVTWLYSRGISSSRVVSAMYAKEFYEANVFDCDLY